MDTSLAAGYPRRLKKSRRPDRRQGDERHRDPDVEADGGRRMISAGHHVGGQWTNRYNMLLFGSMESYEKAGRAL
jgi:hypothetical protein